ncbi:hypothetical protein Tco_0438639 [Tanacetum coccineum]
MWKMDVFGEFVDISPPRSTDLHLQVPPREFSRHSDLPKPLKLVFRRLLELVKEESDIEGRGRKSRIVDPLIKLAKAAATVLAVSSSIPPDVTTGPTDASSNKGKSLMVEEEPPMKERSFRQREEDRLGAEAARRLYEEEQDDQVHANQGLFADLLGPDVNEDNFAARHGGLLKSKEQILEQSDSKEVYSMNLKRFCSAALSRTIICYWSITLDVTQSPFVVYLYPASPPHSPKASSYPDVTPDTSKQPSVAPTLPSGFSATPTVTRTSGPRTRNQSSAVGIKTYSTTRKSLWSRKMSSSEHYEAKPIAGAGMMLWGDLYVLFESVEGGSSVEVWANQKDWVVRSWRLFPFAGCYVREFYGNVLLDVFEDIVCNPELMAVAEVGVHSWLLIKDEGVKDV